MTETVIDVLVTDHREVEQMFTEFEALPADAHERRRQLADKVVIELVRHAVAEEMYVYPAFRQHLPDGDELAEHEISEHSEAEVTMKRIEKYKQDDPKLIEEMHELMRVIRHHISEEESDAFPRLVAAADRAELEQLAEKVQAAKKVAPTRPHPAAPDHPPFNKLLGPGAGLVDRIRDALTGRGKE
jgi:hemerythrin superfamily protein